MFLRVITKAILLVFLHCSLLSKEDERGTNNEIFDETNSWCLNDIQPGLYKLYTSVKDALNKNGNVGFPKIFEGRVLRTYRAEPVDTFRYNWDYDTLYAYNRRERVTKELISSAIWNSSSGLTDYYRNGSMGIRQEIDLPDHHKDEYLT